MSDFMKKAALLTAAVFCIISLITALIGIAWLFEDTGDSYEGVPSSSLPEWFAAFFIFSALTLAFMLAELLVLKAFGAEARWEYAPRPYVPLAAPPLPGEPPTLPNPLNGQYPRQDPQGVVRRQPHTRQDV
jgi:Zn-dependent protease with chaperone function